MHSSLLQIFALNISATRFFWRACILSLILALAAFLPTARAQVSPPPDGGYPGANTAEGDGALGSLTTGRNNTAIGFEALFNNTSGGFGNGGGDGNTAIGYAALFSNQTASGNTATGDFALYNNTGSGNTATGSQALNGNTIGQANTAMGNAAMGANTTGSNNTATGTGALFHNTSGNFNTATGVYALSGAGTNSFNTGNNNTASGYQALLSNTTGNSNIAVGRGALGSNTAGSFNMALGFNAGANLTTGSNNIDIGSVGVAGESNTMRIGTLKQTRTFISGIRGVTTANADAVPVVIDSAGQLGTVSSSRRFKDEIKPMEKSSEAILGLKPVTFHYKTDKQNTPQFGLIAEETAKVNPDLVVRDEKGEIYTVRYEAVNAMLLNEFLKEHRKVEEQEQKLQKQEATIARQQKDFESKLAQQQKQIEALTSTVQKVSERVELSARAPQIAANAD